MTMQEIPDIRYELSEDGKLLTIEQGSIEPVCIQLHKIHIKHLAELMKVSLDEEETSPMLVEFLERINLQAEELYLYLDSIRCMPTSDGISEDVLMAKNLHQTANMALGLWGAN